MIVIIKNEQYSSAFPNNKAELVHKGSVFDQQQPISSMFSVSYGPF